MPRTVWLRWRDPGRRTSILRCAHQLHQGIYSSSGSDRGPDQLEPLENNTDIVGERQAHCRALTAEEARVRVQPPGPRPVALAFVPREAVVDRRERPGSHVRRAHDRQRPAIAAEHEAPVADSGQRLVLRRERLHQLRGRPLGTVQHQGGRARRPAPRSRRTQRLSRAARRSRCPRRTTPPLRVDCRLVSGNVIHERHPRQCYRGGPGPRTAETSAHACRTGSSPIAVTLVPRCRACRTGPWPPDGEADRGPRRRRRAAETRPGHSDAVDLPGQYPCQAPDPGMSPGNVTAVAGQLRFSPPGRGRTWLPGASAPYPGITLSDASEQGERAHSRRSGVRHERERRRLLSLITGNSARSSWRRALASRAPPRARASGAGRRAWPGRPGYRPGSGGRDDDMRR